MSVFLLVLFVCEREVWYTVMRDVFMHFHFGTRSHVTNQKPGGEVELVQETSSQHKCNCGSPRRPTPC